MITSSLLLVLVISSVVLFHQISHALEELQSKLAQLKVSKESEILVSNSVIATQAKHFESVRGRAEQVEEDANANDDKIGQQVGSLALVQMSIRSLYQRVSDSFPLNRRTKPIVPGPYVCMCE